MAKQVIRLQDTITDARHIKSDLSDFALPEPNDRFLGFQPGLRAWYGSQDTTKKINRWIRKRLAQPPALYDSATVNQSVANMELYLFNKGYFGASVAAQVDFSPHQKATITYTISRDRLTYVRNVAYDLRDSTMVWALRGGKQEQVLLPGRPYDVDDILDERRRMENILVNQGYYTFSRQKLFFQIDTIPGTNQLDILIQVLPPDKDSVHRQYFINDIYILPDYTDRLFRPDATTDTLTIGGYHFVYEELRYNPNAIIGAIFLQQGKPYSRTDYQLTINRLTAMQIFRFVNIDLKPKVVDGKHLLDVEIRLMPSKQREVSVNWNATSSSYYFLGSDVGLNYRNKNLFSYTDILNLGLNGGVELVSDSTRGLFLNTVDLNASAALSFPKFLVPFRLKRIPKTHNARTNIIANYNLFRRVDFYTLNNLSLVFGYEWNEKEYARHQVNPIEINFVRLSDTTDRFLQTIQESPTLQQSFQDQLIASSSYTYTYTSQHKGRRNFYYLRLRGEMAGNLLYLAGNALGFAEENGVQQLLGRSFSQYLKPEAEIKYYYRLPRNQVVVFRALGGMGFAYGNSGVMPFIKQFTIGGSNSIRAFRIRELGPGSYSGLDRASNIALNDRSGEIKLEGNIEYRFDINSMFKGALFADFGNIWMRQDDPDREGEDFRFDRFYRELAVGVGAGLRIDFSFFIGRIDLGIPVRDPRITDNGGWRFDEIVGAFNPLSGAWRRDNLRLQLAIGYPF